MPEGPPSNQVLAFFSQTLARIPGDFEDDLPDEFFDTVNGVAEVVVYKEFGGAPDLALKAMYDAESTTVDPETGGIRSSNPLIWIATKDAPNVTNKDSFVVCGNTFRVRSVMPDGSGVTEIELTKDA